MEAEELQQERELQPLHHSRNSHPRTHTRRATHRVPLPILQPHLPRLLHPLLLLPPLHLHPRNLDDSTLLLLSISGHLPCAPSLFGSCPLLSLLHIPCPSSCLRSFKHILQFYPARASCSAISTPMCSQSSITSNKNSFFAEIECCMHATEQMREQFFSCCVVFE